VIDLPVRGTNWQLHTWPTRQLLAAQQSRLPVATLIGGLLLATLLGCTTFFAQASRRRERQVIEAKNVLEQQITERQQMENALRASEERYKTLVHVANDIIYQTDTAGHFIFVNPTASRVTKYAEEELIGRPFLDLVVPGNRKAVEEFYTEQFARSTSNTYLEFSIVTKDDVEVWIGQNVQLVHDHVGQGRVTGFQAVARDITERKRTEAELAKGRDAALESTRLKSQFLATMSHEIRTPMNGIIGMTELLLNTELTAEQRECAETVHSCGGALLTLLNDVLDLSKIEAGKLELDPADFSVRQLVRQTVELLAERAQSKGLNLFWLINADVPDMVCGDPWRLRQVLTNLLANAIKFTERGEVKLQVRLQDEAGSGAVLHFEISDTGIGMSEETQAKLFQPFVQAHSSTTHAYGGTGLGLAICKQLVELMGGAIGLRSEPQEGSTFWFTARLTVPTTLSEPQVLSRADLRGLRVLVINDLTKTRHTLCQLLGCWGMKATEAPDADAALDSLKAAAKRGEPYDIALVDLETQHTTSFALARTIKADPLIAPVRVVIMTAFGQRGDGLEARRLGVAAYLTRPVRQSQLFDCLAMVMNPSAPSGRSPEANSTTLVTRHSLEVAKSQLRGPILVVEDNAVNRKVVVGQLKKLGYRADIAFNGVEALEALRRTSYALVLMDGQMPEMDGFTTTAEIRRRELDGRRTPIVALTAHAMKGERERCLNAGMDDYLSKPVRLEELAAVLERLSLNGHPTTKPELSEPACSNPSGVVDRQVLACLRELKADGEPDVLSELIQMFLQETPQRLAALAEAVAGPDTAATERLVHSLKGSCGTLGASRMAALCEQLEHHTQREQSERMASSLRQLEEEFARVRTALEMERTRTAEFQGGAP